MPITHHHTVATPGGRTVVGRSAAESGVTTDHVERRTWGSFSVAQVLHGLCGLFLVVFGAIATGRGGFGDGEAIGERTGEVLGITLSTLLGLVALAAGVVLLLAALSPAGRGTGGVLGVLLLVAGIVVAAGSDELLADLHTETALGWVGIVVGAVAVLAALLPSHTMSRHSTEIDVHDDRYVDDGYRDSGF